MKTNKPKDLVFTVYVNKDTQVLGTINKKFQEILERSFSKQFAEIDRKKWAKEPKTSGH